MLIAVVVTVLTLVLTVPLAYLLARYPVPFKPLILLVFLLPHAFPSSRCSSTPPRSSTG